MSFSIGTRTELDDERLKAFAEASASLRRLQDAFVGAAPDTESLHRLSADLDAAASSLEAHQVDESWQIAGRLDELPFRGLPIQPDMVTQRRDRDEIAGHLVLTRFFLGAGAAAHGGVPPLMFDQLMGDVASIDRSVCRTAYLRTQYRAVTPLDVRLDIRVWVEREEGRKRFVRGELRHGETLCVEADGLFVAIAGAPPRPA